MTAKKTKDTNAKAAEMETSEIVMVKMQRDRVQFPDKPCDAEVHPDEVTDWQNAGWSVVTEADAE